MSLWGSRFSEHPAAALWSFSASSGVDARLAPEDLAASSAHVRGLERAGLIDDEEMRALLEALATVESEIGDGHDSSWAAADEDVHSAIERRVTELLGPLGGKLHTGRSRNDQVATAFRLHVRSQLVAVGAGLLELTSVLARLARSSGDASLPGYTHLQRAQPVLLAHYLLAHGWALHRDLDRVLDALERVDVSPLGAGALAGSSLPLDPQWVAAEIGFKRCFENSLDAVADRDFVAEALFVVALIGVHLSRLAEELVLFSTAEFGFVRFSDDWATGSSMLPQKKNPDVAELVRGRSGRLIGDLVSMLTVLKGLPLSYNRDLQEDKEPLFDAVDHVRAMLGAITGLLEHTQFDHEVMARAASDAELAAIDLAEWLVATGVPFRQAHQIIGELVAAALAEQVPLRTVVERHPLLGPDAASLLVQGTAVRRRTTWGAAGPDAVARQLERFEALRHRDLDRVAQWSGRTRPPRAPRGPS